MSLTNVMIANNASIEGKSDLVIFGPVTGPNAAENINASGLLLNYGTISNGGSFNTLNISLGNYTALLNQSGGTISGGGSYDHFNIEGNNGPVIFS